MRSLAAVSLLLALSAPAAADTGAELPSHVYLEWDRSAIAGGNDAISNIIYLNRCAGGCTITKSQFNNALTDESRIPMGSDGQVFTVGQFAYSDTTWNAIVQCVREVYAPYNVEITDVDPGNVTHHMAIVAGLNSDLGWPSGVLGVGGGAGCEPANNVISFTFANNYRETDVLEICATVAQESAHAFGLADHIYDCTDPMTYLSGCGKKYFRDRLSPCGEFEQRECTCTGTRQNSHIKLLSVFGAGETPAAPTGAQILFPENGAAVGDTMTIEGVADDPRGIYKVEVFLNGWPWGQWDAPDPISAPWPPSNYVVNIADFPPGVIDVDMVFSNDFGVSSSASIQVTKGAPCTDASQCAEGQSCDAGKCLWASPAGQLGDACSYDQFCLGPNTFDGRCVTVNGSDVCSQDCYSGVNDNCPEDFRCAETSPGTGFCVADDTDEGGCCSTSRDPSPVAPLLLGGVVGGLVLRRRRRVR